MSASDPELALLNYLKVNHKDETQKTAGSLLRDIVRNGLLLAVYIYIAFAYPKWNPDQSARGALPFFPVKKPGKTKQDIENDVTDIQEDELSEISEVEDEEATEISIDITVEHAVENVIKKIESKPTTSINVSFANAVNNVENRVERISLGDDITTVSINGFVNEDEGYTNYIVCIDDVFSKLRGLNSLSNYDLQHSPRKPLVIKKRYSEFFKFDKELIIHFDKNSYGIPSLPPKTWCRNMSEAFVTRRAVDLNNYIKVISKETNIRNSELYKNFIMMGEERK